MPGNTFSNKVNTNLSSSNKNFGSGLSLSQGSLYKNNGNLSVPVSPLSKALSNVSSGNTASVDQRVRVGLQPSPSTPLKSVTTNNIDGSSTIHEYHAPPKTDSNIPKAEYGPGLLNGRQISQAQPEPNTNPTYSGLIKNALDLQNKATEYERTVNETNQNIRGNENYSLDTQVGRQGLVNQTAAIQQNALNQQAKNALTAAGLVAPVSQFGVLTDPTTGKPISGDSVGAAAFKGGQVVGQQDLGKQVSQMNAANTAAKGIEGTITQYLSQNPNLNPSDLTFANSIAQWASGQQLGDPKYQTLANYLNEYISTLAPILGVGGDTTNLKTQIAQSMINAKASGQSIAEVLSNMSKLADDKLANIISSGQGGGQVAGGMPGAAGTIVQTSAGPVNTNW